MASNNKRNDNYNINYNYNSDYRDSNFPHNSTYDKYKKYSNNFKISNNNNNNNKRLLLITNNDSNQHKRKIKRATRIKRQRKQEIRQRKQNIKTVNENQLLNSYNLSDINQNRTQGFKPRIRTHGNARHKHERRYRDNGGYYLHRYLPQYNQTVEYSAYSTKQKGYTISRVYNCFTRNMSIIKKSVIQNIQQNELSLCKLYTNSFKYGTKSTVKKS